MCDANTPVMPVSDIVQSIWLPLSTNVVIPVPVVVFGGLSFAGDMAETYAFAIGAVLPGSFVARADMFTGRASGILARILRIIPIERTSLRLLPGVVDAVARRLRAGQTVVAEPR